MRGSTSASSKSSRVSTTSARMPDTPTARLFALSSMIRRTMCAGSGSPTPQAWLRTRLYWSVRISSRGMRWFANAPNPVLTP
jgi:hypothetical protein